MKAEIAIEVARNLLQLGLPASALNLLEPFDSPCPEANALRRQARRSPRRPSAGIYVLTALDDRGLALRCKPDQSRTPTAAFDVEATNACRNAFELACSLLQGRPISLRLPLPHGLDVQGSSLGLGAALAFVGKLANVEPARPIFATGALDPAGNVLPVGHIPAKVAIAREELGGTSGLILVPPGSTTGDGAHEVATLADAVRMAFGTGELRIDPGFLSARGNLEKSRSIADHHEAAAFLEEALSSCTLRLADRAILEFELGCRLRHAGESARAAAVHRRVQAELEAEEDPLDATAIEDLEMEALASEIDQYELGTIESRLRKRLAERFSSRHNRIRCRGMLAQVCSTLGRHAEALALRTANLDAQDASEALFAERAFTLCWMTLDAARLGDSDRFHELGKALLDCTPLDSTGRDNQTRFNESALVRGLVLLGRGAEALAWARGGEGPWAVRASDRLRAIVGGAPAEGHPEVSTVRALARALRRTGSAEEAVALVDRATATGPLVQWLLELARAEGLLAAGNLAQLPAVATRLEQLHPPATLFHAGLVHALRTADAPQLEREIDRVTY